MSSRSNCATVADLIYLCTTTTTTTFLVPAYPGFLEKRPLNGCVLLQPFNGLFSRTTWVSRYQKGTSTSTRKVVVVVVRKYIKSATVAQFDLDDLCQYRFKFVSTWLHISIIYGYIFGILDISMAPSLFTSLRSSL